MASSIIITQNAVSVEASRDDLVLIDVITFGNATIVGSYAWTLLDKPTGSAAALSSASNPTTNLIPDVEGTYLVRLVTDGVDSNQRGAGIKFSRYGFRAPAATETLEYGVTGWKPAANAGFTNLNNSALNRTGDTMTGALLFANIFGALTIPVGGSFAALSNVVSGGVAFNLVASDNYTAGSLLTIKDNSTNLQFAVSMTADGVPSLDMYRASSLRGSLTTNSSNYLVLAAISGASTGGTLQVQGGSGQTIGNGGDTIVDGGEAGTVSGASGNMFVRTKDALDGVTGTIYLQTGSVTGANIRGGVNADAFQYVLQTTFGDGDTATDAPFRMDISANRIQNHLFIIRDNTNISAAIQVGFDMFGDNTPQLSFYQSNAVSGSLTQDSTTLTLATSSGSSRIISLVTGDASSSTGNMTLKTGDSSATASGNITLTTGTAATTRGNITGSALNYTWTSSKADGDAIHAFTIVITGNMATDTGSLFRIQDNSGDDVLLVRRTTAGGSVLILSDNGTERGRIESNNDITIRTVNTGTPADVRIVPGTATAAGQSGGDFEVLTGAGAGAGNSGGVTLTAGTPGGSGTYGSMVGSFLKYAFTANRAATDALDSFVLDNATVFAAATGTVFKITSSTGTKNIFRIKHNTTPDGTLITIANDAGTDTGLLNTAGAFFDISTFSQAAASAAIRLFTGVSTGAGSGLISLTTGVATGANNSGLISFVTGTPGATGASGAISLTTGAGGSVSGGSGSISFTVGTPVSGTRGSITGDSLDYTFTSWRGATDSGNAFTITTGATSVTNGRLFRVLTNTGQLTFQIRAIGAANYSYDFGDGAAGLKMVLNQAGVGTTFTGATGSGSFTFTPQASTGAADGGFFTLRAGAAGTGTSAGGNITLTTGVGSAFSGTGASGTLSLSTGVGGTTSGVSAPIFLTTGNTTDGATGKIEFVTGNAAGGSARNSGAFNFVTGTPSTTGASGDFLVTTGAGGSVSGASGGVQFITGNTTSGATGGYSFTSGLSTAAASGSFTVVTGDTVTSGASGSINFTTGNVDATGASGSFNITIGTPGGGFVSGSLKVSGAANFDLTAGGVQTLTSADAGAGGAPDLILYRNSASAAANDVLGRIIFDGNSATPTRRTMGVFQSVLVTATDTAEDAKLEWYTILGGSSNLAMWLSQGGQLNVDLDGTGGTVVVFDDYDDVGLIRSVDTLDANKRAAGLRQFEELGIVSRKRVGRDNSYEGYCMGIQPAFKLTWGAIRQTREKLDDTVAVVNMLKAQNTKLKSDVEILIEENAWLHARTTILEARPA